MANTCTPCPAPVHRTIRRAFRKLITPAVPVATAPIIVKIITIASAAAMAGNIGLFAYSVGSAIETGKIPNYTAPRGHIAADVSADGTVTYNEGSVKVIVPTNCIPDYERK